MRLHGTNPLFLCGALTALLALASCRTLSPTPAPDAPLSPLTEQIAECRRKFAADKVPSPLQEYADFWSQRLAAWNSGAASPSPAPAAENNPLPAPADFIALPVESSCHESFPLLLEALASSPLTASQHTELEKLAITHRGLMLFSRLAQAHDALLRGHHDDDKSAPLRHFLQCSRAFIAFRQQTAALCPDRNAEWICARLQPWCSLWTKYNLAPVQALPNLWNVIDHTGKQTAAVRFAPLPGDTRSGTNGVRRLRIEMDKPDSVPLRRLALVFPPLPGVRRLSVNFKAVTLPEPPQPAVYRVNDIASFLRIEIETVPGSECHFPILPVCAALLPADNTEP